jgi:hypothetical protein
VFAFLVATYFADPIVSLAPYQFARDRIFVRESRVLEVLGVDALLRLVVLIVDGVSFGQHALMQDARNQNAATFLAVEHDMPAMLVTAQAGANVFAKSACRRVFGKRLATNLKLVDVADHLGLAPFAKGVIGDAQQVSLSAARKSKPGHG